MAEIGTIPFSVRSSGTLVEPDPRLVRLTLRELSTVAVVFLTLVGLAYGIAFVGQPRIYELAWLSMTVIGLGAVTSEIVYFAALFVSLRRIGEVPDRWYARSFEHHRKLSAGQRRAVLPFFYIGFVGLIVALLIAVVLVFASLGVFRDLPLDDS